MDYVRTHLIGSTSSGNPTAEELLTVASGEFVKLGHLREAQVVSYGQRGERNLVAALHKALDEELLRALAVKAPEVLHLGSLLSQGARRGIQRGLRRSAGLGAEHGDRGEGRGGEQAPTVKFGIEPASEAPLPGQLHDGEAEQAKARRGKGERVGRKNEAHMILARNNERNGGTGGNRSSE